MDENEGRRSRRSKVKEPSAALKALDKIKKFRETGEKVDYELTKEDDLYEEVDERKYAEIVQDRREDGWIVDDDGSGYVDDGREIFDDDPNEAPPVEKKGDAKKKVEKPKAKSSKITNMFANAQLNKKKKTEEKVTLAGDDVLEDILNSIGTTGSQPRQKSKQPDRTPKRPNKPTPRRLQETTPMMSIKKTPTTDRSFRTPFATKTEEDTQKKTKPSIKPSIKQENEPVEQNMVDSDYGSEELLEAMADDELMDVKMEDPASQPLSEMSEFDMTELDDDICAGMEEDSGSSTKKIDAKFDDSGTFNITSNWSTTESENSQAMVDVKIDSSTLPLTITEGGERVLRFFFLDAYEDRYNQPGVVYLFGKVWVEAAKSHVSCCLKVKNIEREVYLLPRATRFDRHGNDTGTPVTFKDVYEEFNETVTNQHRIMKFKCRKANRKYAFEKTDVPDESEYLEVRYPASQPQLPMDLKGETFSHTFGTNTSSLEHLFLNRDLQGPTWIDIKHPQIAETSMSWCKIEATVDNPDFLTVTTASCPTPPMTVLSLSMLTIPHLQSHSHEIIGVCGLVNSNVYLDRAAPKDPFQHSFCFVSKPADQMMPFDFQATVQKMKLNIQSAASERSLLGLFLARIQTIDPDIIVGHDVHGFDFDVILHRISDNKVPHWSKLGRLKRSTLPKLSGTLRGGKKQESGIDKSAACGRIVCDIKISAKELIRCKSYDLTELVSSILNENRDELLAENVAGTLKQTSTLLTTLDHARMDSLYTLRLMYELNVLPLAYQITGICGNVLSRTLLGGRAERNEFLLLHAFHRKAFIPPDKTFASSAKKDKSAGANEEEGAEGTKKSARKKPAYAGGLVLEPKKGFYDKYILLLDYNSLYPSIIQEYNICFTTIKRDHQPDTAQGEEYFPDLPDPSLEAGILPTEIRHLVERRKGVKNLMKNEPSNSDLYAQYDIRQKALKLTANSMYGCLGFSHSRFYAKPLAALVTGKGREILMKTKDLAQQLGLDVIYGDTDSIMINTNSTDLQEVIKIGNKVKTEVNKLYKLLEIDIDGIYKSMLLLKKKKYAALLVETRPDGSVVEKKEMKGLDIVRRDWCDLAKDAGNFALTQILSSDNTRDAMVEAIHDYLRLLKESLDSGNVDMSKFEINKSLSKNPEDYPDKKSLPHVTVAQRMITQGRRVAVGDTISYVICEDGSNLAATQRAYSPEECIKNSALKIDHTYYLANQVHPVVSRLCDPIEGTDSALIAGCLGLDASSYKSRSSAPTDKDEEGLKALMAEDERFMNVDKFYVFCKNASCSSHKTEVEFVGSFATDTDPFACATCTKQFDLPFVKNKLSLMMRENINRYYKCWLSCDDSACGHTSRHISVKQNREAQLCQQCHKGFMHAEYTDGMLYDQMYYLLRLFDVRKIKSEAPYAVRGSSDSWSDMFKLVDSYVKKNAYSMVNLGDLFKVAAA